MGCSSILVALNLLWICVAASVDMGELAARANIYYQRPTSPSGGPRELKIADVQDFAATEVIKLIVHGFSSSRASNSIRPLRHAYMANGVDVFVADWRDAAAVDYPRARSAVGLVAACLAKRLQDFIEKHRADPSNVHLVGHSLGAHIAGGIGQHFNGTLGRITGLDPALPFFTPYSRDGLAATAARFVDVVHTDFPVFGDITARGTVDFYPHFGLTPQPGCGALDLNSIRQLIFRSYSCSHNRAVALYAESITLPKSLPAIPCSACGIKLRSVAECLQKWGHASANPPTFAAAITDESVVVYMGEGISKSAAGLYYLETFDSPPFGKGEA